MAQKLSLLKTPWPWYDSIEKTTMRNSDCEAFRYKLITPRDRLMPFLFRFPGPDVITLPLHLKIYNSDTGILAYTVADTITAAYIDYYRFDTWDYLVYKGTLAIPDLDMATGFYYAELEMQDGTKYYSEEFWVDCDITGNTLSSEFSDDFNDDFDNLFLPSLSKYTKLSWWHACDIGNLLYQTGYQNMLYLDAELLKTETALTEEGEENGDRDFVTKFIKAEDKISFSDYVPEHIINALSGVYLHEFVYLTTKYDQYIGKAKKFTTKHAYETLCHGKVDVEFLMETTLERTGCCGNNTLQNIYQCTGQISDLGFESADNGDGTKSIGIHWNVLLGSGPWRVMSPQISGGAFHDVDATTYDMGDWAPGTELYVSVKPKCEAANGRVMFGNELTLQIFVP